LLGNPRMAPFIHAERVEALPVEDLMGTLKPGEAASDLGLAAKFRILLEPHPLDSEAIARVRLLLKRASSYEDAVSGCSFAPTVAIRFTRGEAFVDVILGNECHQVAFAADGADRLEYFVTSEEAARTLSTLAREALTGR